jgi:hypothetical protein
MYNVLARWAMADGAEVSHLDSVEGSGRRQMQQLLQLQELRVAKQIEQMVMKSKEERASERFRIRRSVAREREMAEVAVVGVGVVDVDVDVG